MSEGSPLSSLARLGAFAVLPAGAVLILVGLVSIESTDGTLIRFANALLTSFTFVSFILLLTLFV